MAAAGGRNPARRRVRWVLSHLVTPLIYAGVATLLVASTQSLFSQRGVAANERDLLSWLLVHRPARPPDPRLAFVVADDRLWQTQRFAHELPVTPSGPRPLDSYRPKERVLSEDTHLACRCPIPRRCYAEAVRRLKKWGARVVVLDVMLSAACALEDEELKEALLQSGDVVLAAYFNPLPSSSSRDMLRTSDLQFKYPAGELRNAAVVGSPVIDPMSQEYAIELEQTGQLDPAGTRMEPREEGSDAGALVTFGALAWETVCLAENRMPDETGPWNRFLVEGTQPRLLGNLFSLPAAQAQSESDPGGAQFNVVRGNVLVDESLNRKHLLINYSTGAEESQGRYPMSRLSWLLACPDDAGKKLYGDKIVLIGDPARDRHKTVVGELPGTEVLANAVSSILERRPLRVVPPSLVLWLMLGTAILAVVLIRESPAVIFVPGLVALNAGLLWVSQLLIARDWWLLTVSPLAAVDAASLFILVWQSKAFRQQIGRLAPGPIMRLAERAGGFTVEECSVIFSDIRGYTTISETMHPAEVLTYLNRYMSSVDAILAKHGGEFVTCPGDCVVAWFHDEGRGRTHRERSIRCGLEMLKNAERFGVEWKKETGLDFAVGMGINTGEMAVGCLEAHRHMEATIIGDAVNTAARIESMTKEYGRFLVSEETLDPVRELFETEYVDEIHLKGRTRPVRLYRVSGIADPKSSANQPSGGRP